MVSIQPREGERALVEGVLGPVRWLCDGDDTRGVHGLVSLWPRRELREAGRSWQDFPDLQWVKVATAGVNHVPWQDVPAHVAVLSTPGSTAPAIAEYVLGATIAWARGFMRSTRDIAAGEFHLGRPTRAVAELRIGTVGHGGVGQAVARAMAAHGATVRAVNRSGRQEPGAPVEEVATVEALPRLASWADVLVLCLPLRRATRGLVDASILDALGAGLLVNVARGPVVVEDDLHAWLAADARRGAALDVWWRYARDGRPYTQPFHELPNVVMTPHNSANTTGFRARMLGRAVHDVAAQGQGPLLHAEQRDDHTGDGSKGSIKGADLDTSDGGVL